MTGLIVDSSVLIKWFHSDGESEVAQARAVRTAHAAGEVDAYLLDLGLYEVGNVLTRALHWRATDVAAQLDDLITILGPALNAAPAWHRRAAGLAEVHRLTFYDASWAAAAVELGMPLVSADRRLLAAGLAESPAETATRLRLPVD